MADGRAGPHPSSESESGSGSVVGRWERSAGGGAGPRMRFTVGARVGRGLGSALGGGAGPVSSESESASRRISSVFAAGGGSAGPICGAGLEGCCGLACGLANVGGRVGPIEGRDTPAAGGLRVEAGVALGPKPSSEEQSPSKGISSSLSRLVVFGGGAAWRESSCGVRLRF